MMGNKYGDYGGDYGGGMMNNHMVRMEQEMMVADRIKS